MTRHVLVAALVAWSAAVSCGGKNNSAWSNSATAQQPGSQVAAGSTAPTTSSGKGIGPVVHVDLASLGDSRAPAGAKVFQEKCTACHKLDEKYIGPPLAGVTERRQPEWILNMILNPEVMVQQDPTARALLAEFIAPMANQHLTLDEAESILVYFREHDEERREIERGENDEEDGDDEESSAPHRTNNGH
jgi:mono/diheme cytochrome c family protein